MDPYIGQIILVPYTFAPRGWAFCQGQLLPISQNTALYSLLGNTFGGDGRTTFALPNLTGNIVPGPGTDSFGNNYPQGSTGGATTVALSLPQLAAHTHSHQGTTAAGTTNGPAGAVFAQNAGRGSSVPYYVAPTGSQATMATSVLTPVGGSSPHDNIMPIQALNYVIALTGIYPQRP